MTTAEKETTKELRPLSDYTVTTSALIAKEIVAPKKVDGTVASLTITAETYLKHAKEAGIDIEAAEKKQAFDTQFIAAALHGFSAVVAPVLAANKAVEKAELVIPTIGRDTIELGYKRQEEVSDGVKDEDGKFGRKTVYGQTSVKVKSYASGNRGELSRVKDAISASAAALFS